MKRVYFAGNFDLSGPGANLPDRLVPDHRSRLLTYASPDMRIPGRRLIWLPRLEAE